jgi:hypothetical protein
MLIQIARRAGASSGAGAGRASSLSRRVLHTHAAIGPFRSWLLVEMTGMAVDAITDFSVKPLRFAFYTGCLTAILSALYLAYILSELAAGHTVEGSTSLMVALLFLGALQLVTLGIVGEYVGRIYDQTRGRPRYKSDASPFN